MIFEAVKEFHKVYQVYTQERPAMPPREVVELRVELIREEFQDELLPAIERGDLVEVADALGDLLYVVAGAGLAFGIDLEPIFREIHRSNMSKLGEDGKPILRESDKKVLKGPNYSPPDIASIIHHQAGR